MCARKKERKKERSSFVFWSLDRNQSRQLANGGQGDKEKEEEKKGQRDGVEEGAQLLLIPWKAVDTRERKEK